MLKRCGGLRIANVSGGPFVGDAGIAGQPFDHQPDGLAVRAAHAFDGGRHGATRQFAQNDPTHVFSLRLVAAPGGGIVRQVVLVRHPRHRLPGSGAKTPERLRGTCDVPSTRTS